MTWIDWGQQNNQKPYSVGDNVPEWQKMGFPDAASYAAAYPGRDPGAVSGGSPTGGGTGGPHVTSDTTFNQYLTNNPGANDAWSYLQTLLQSYGLGSLDSFAKDQIVQGRSSNEVIQRMRETPEYQQRFSALIERQKKGLSPISESDQINLERQYEATSRRFGLPQSFYDNPEDFHSLIVGDVSPDEYQSRIVDGYVAYNQAAPEVKAEFKALGFGDGDAVAYWLDPQKAQPLLQQQLATAKVGAAGVTTGYGQITADQAMQLASQGITEDQARQGFGTLAGQAPLFNALPGEANDNIGTSDQLSAAFSNNANAQRRIASTKAQREAPFQGGGGYGTSKEGFSGAGSSQNY